MHSVLTQEQPKSLPKIKAMARPNDTRWDSQYDFIVHFMTYFQMFPSFYAKVCTTLLCHHSCFCLQAVKISKSEVVADIHKLILENSLRLKAQGTFVVVVLKTVYDSIKTLQKESGGILDVLNTFQR